MRIGLNKISNIFAYQSVFVGCGEVA